MVSESIVGLRSRKDAVQKSFMISIIIPTYNRRELLIEALERLFEEGHENFECIIVDDASDDGTLDLIQKHFISSAEASIKTVGHQSQMGAQIARNAGIEIASGDYLMFMDSDDVPFPDGILNLRDKLLKSPHLDYCFGVVQKTDGELNPLEPEEIVGAPFKDVPEDIAGYHWHTMGALYRRSCIEQVGSWNPDLSGSQDWEYQARVKISGAKGEFTNTLVGYWRQHKGNRVGTTEFRPDYVRSVMSACESIVSKARAAGRCDSKLEKRIAKRLVIHALEWGTNGYRSERRECFEIATSLSKCCFLTHIGIKFLSALPSCSDYLAYRALARI